jgi:DNA replication protein DnaC
MSVKYIRAHDLLADILMARSQGTYHKLKIPLAKLHLLVIDEWLREPLAPSHAREFLDLFDDRYRKASCLMISQLPWWTGILRFKTQRLLMLFSIGSFTTPSALNLPGSP